MVFGIVIVAMDKARVRQFGSNGLNLLKGFSTILVIGYITYSVGLAIYKNYQTNQQIAELKIEIESIKQQIAELNNLIVYYKSDSFKELEARRRLGLRAKDEQIIILPKPEQRPTEEIINQQDTSGRSSKQSNILNWYEFIFGNKNP